MPQKKGILRAFFILLLAAFIGVAGLFLLCSNEPQISSFEPKSDNEKFLDLQQKYSNLQERRILNILEPLVGYGKVKVAVQLDINLKHAHVGQYKEISDFTSPSPTRPTATQTRSFEKQIQNLIQQQHVSIVVDGNTQDKNKEIYQPRTQKEMDVYKRLVESAIGYNSRRGDTLEIQNMPFVSEKPFSPIPLAPIFEIFLIVVAALLIFFGILSCLISSSHSQKESTFSSEMLDQITKNPERIIAVIRNWIYMPTKSHKTDWLPIQKVGILLLALDENIVKQILVALDDDEVRQIAKTMTTLGVIPPSESARILKELYEAMFTGSAVVGNPQRVQQILSKSIPSENASIPQTIQNTHTSLWQELASVNSHTLALRLSDIASETVAYILYQLSSQKAGEIVQHLPEKKVTQVLLHLSHIGHLSTAVTQKVEQDALTIVRQILDTLHAPSGTEKTSEILTQISDTPIAQKVMQDISQKEPNLARKLASQLIRFEDISNWSDSNIQTLLKHTLRTTAVDAFAHAPNSILDTLKRNIPTHLWTSFLSEIQQKEIQLTDSQILKARQTIVDTARSLLQEGKINI